MSMKNSNDTIGNRTRDLPTCSAVPQLTVLPRAPYSMWYLQYIHQMVLKTAKEIHIYARSDVGRSQKKYGYEQYGPTFICI
jgi:hypothetical protein